MYRLLYRRITRPKQNLKRFYSYGKSSNESNDSNIVAPLGLGAAAFFTANKDENTSINEAIKKNDYRTVREIVESGDTESSTNYNKLGWTPLILAAAWDKTMIAKLLLENGADPDSQDKYHPPVKQRITRHDRYFSKADQERFDQRTADFPDHINPQADFNGATALFYATLNNNIEMVDLLLKYGADPLIKLRSGLHPLEVVNVNSERGIQIKAMLLKFGSAVFENGVK